MENRLNISVPKPCHENWEKMMPDSTGKFCGSCARNVVDFTTKLPSEIQQYFTEHQNERICGRFKNSQLQKLTIQIPQNILFSQTNYTKMFLLALLISMGTTLFSCSDAEGNKQEIENVEIVTDPLSFEHATIGISVPTDMERKMYPPPPPPPAPKIKEIKFVAPFGGETTTGDIVVETDSSNVQKEIHKIPLNGARYDTLSNGKLILINSNSHKSDKE